MSRLLQLSESVKGKVSTPENPENVMINPCIS
jgi:hypothetical protein